MNGNHSRDVLRLVELESNLGQENVTVLRLLEMEKTALEMNKKIENATLYHVVHQ